MQKNACLLCRHGGMELVLCSDPRVGENNMITELFLWIVLDQILQELHDSSVFAFLFLFARLVEGTLSSLLDLVTRLSCVLLCRTCQSSLVTWDRTGLEEGRWNLL